MTYIAINYFSAQRSSREK